jgi:hypothetical protein
MTMFEARIVAAGPNDDVPRRLRAGTLLLSGASVGRIETIRIGDFDVIIRVNDFTPLYTLGMAALDDSGEIWATTWCFARHRHDAASAAKRLGNTAAARRQMENRERIFDADAAKTLAARGAVSATWCGIDVRVRVRAYRHINIAVLTPRRGQGNTLPLHVWHTPETVIEMAEGMLPAMVMDRLYAVTDAAFGLQNDV